MWFVASQQHLEPAYSRLAGLEVVEVEVSHGGVVVSPVAYVLA